MKRSSFIFLAIFLLLLTSITVVQISSCRSNTQKTRCRAHLRQIHALYVIQKGKNGVVNRETFNSFWGNPRNVNESDRLEFFKCPFVGSEGERFDYMGPMEIFHKNAEDIFCCDRLENHPDGTVNILSRSGSVRLGDKNEFAGSFGSGPGSAEKPDGSEEGK